MRIEYFAYMLLVLLAGSVLLGVIRKLKGGSFLPEPTIEEDRYVLGSQQMKMGNGPARYWLPRLTGSWNFMGTGTMLCARNSGVDEVEPHIVTKWITFFYFRFWPLATLKVQAVGSFGTGLPGVGGLLKTLSIVFRY